MFEDMMELVILFGTLGGSLGFGLLLGFLYYRYKIKKIPIVGSFMRSNLIAISYDLDNDRIEFIPVRHVGRGVYFSIDRTNPLLIVKKEDILPISTNFPNKKVLFTVAKKPHALAVNQTMMTKLGILDIVVNPEEKKELSKNEFSRESYLMLLKKLAGYQQDYLGKVTISPNIKFGIAVKIPELAKALLSLLTSLAVVSIEGLRDNLLSARVFLEWMKYAVKFGGGKSEWIRYIIIAGVILAVLFMVIGLAGG